MRIRSWQERSTGGEEPPPSPRELGERLGVPRARIDHRPLQCQDLKQGHFACVEGLAGQAKALLRVGEDLGLKELDFSASLLEGGEGVVDVAPDLVDACLDFTRELLAAREGSSDGVSVEA